MWLLFSVLAAMLFAMVCVLDAFCIEDIFEKPWFGMLTSAVATTVVYIPLPFLYTHISWSFVWDPILLGALLAGVLIQLSQLLYFIALAKTEAGIVAAYWNLIPAFIPFLSIILLHEVLDLKEYVGIAILIASSSFLLILDSNKTFRLHSFLLMFGASWLQAFAYILLDSAYASFEYLQVFYFMCTGIVLIGILPIAFTKVRRTLRRGSKKLLRSIHLFVIIEIINLCALAAAQKGIDIGSPALVAAMETTMPAFVLLFSIFAYSLTWKLGDLRSKQNFLLKLSSVAVMVIGVAMIA